MPLVQPAADPSPAVAQACNVIGFDLGYLILIGFFWIRCPRGHYHLRGLPVWAKILLGISLALIVATTVASQLVSAFTLHWDHWLSLVMGSSDAMALVICMVPMKYPYRRYEARHRVHRPSTYYLFGGWNRAGTTARGAWLHRHLRGHRRHAGGSGLA